MCDTCVDCDDVVENGKLKLGKVVSATMVEDAAKKKKFYRASLLLFDVPVISLGILFLVIGVALAIGLFFGLRQKEADTALRAMKDYAILSQSLFDSYFAKVAGDGQNFAYLIALRGATLSRREFDLFSSRGLSQATNGEATSTVIWLPRLTQANRASMVNFFQQQYANTSVVFQPYYLHAQPNGTQIRSSIPYDYPWDNFVVGFTQPFAPASYSGIGYDISSDPVRNHTINVAVSTGLMSATSRIVQVFDDPVSGPWSAAFFSDVRSDGGDLLGIVGMYFRISEIVSVVHQSADISIFDASDNLSYLYTTNAEWRYIYPNVTSKSLESERALLQMLSEMEYLGVIPPRVNITVGDRKWVAFVSPNQVFYAAIQLDQASKWIALGLSLAFGIGSLLLSIGIVIVKRLLYTATVNGLMSHKIEDLQAQRDKMDYLIERLASEEQRVRGIVNIIPMSVLIVSSSGHIVYANDTFIQHYSYSAATISGKQLPISQVLPQIDIDALTGEGKLVAGYSLLYSERIVIRTGARSQLGVEKIQRVAVTYHSASFLGRGRGATHKNFMAYRRNARNLLHNSMSLDNAFVFIIFDGYYDSMSDLSNKSNKSPRMQTYRGGPDASLDDSSKQEDVAETKTFYRMLYDADSSSSKELLEEFRAFCAKEHSPEGLRFFDMVEKYRRTERFMARVELQTRIVEDFLEENSPHQLNLPSSKLKAKMPKLKECLGQPDVFDEVLEYVLLDLRLDLFSRFYKRKLHYKSQSTLVSSPGTPMSEAVDVELIESQVTADEPNSPL